MKRLLLLRHAKTVPGGPDDHERPLMARGRADAPAMGRYIRDHGYEPELILSSTSRRTVETVELLTVQLQGPARTEYIESLYLAAPAAILGAVRGAPDKVKTLMVVGHNPGMEAIATELAREPVKRKERDRFDLIEEKFPTAALAVLDFDVSYWRDVEAGKGALSDFVRPRDL
ncbi:MAG TPA: histidine phosphatase family protein [Rhizomicrobium sp.]|nr:histidine phosphatase family protein [Rhizomicrobium sp.]